MTFYYFLKVNEVPQKLDFSIMKNGVVGNFLYGLLVWNLNSFSKISETMFFIILTSFQFVISDNCFAYLLKIAALESLSGRSNLILRSILLNIAASISCFLLVAHIKRTSVVLSKLSIFLSKVESILRLA